MRRSLMALILVLVAHPSWAQSQVWLDVQAGAAVYLDPVASAWVPVTGKQQIPEQTYLLVKPDARLRLFKEAEVYDLPEAAYFYVADVPRKRSVEVVSALTRIEASQLPSPPAEPKPPAHRPIGLTYGNPPDTTAQGGAIPYETERAAAIAWFYERERLDAALLSLKRMMTRHPDLYLDRSYVKQLLQLYEQLELYGFLLDETKRLMKADVSPSFEQTLLRWHDLATEKLLRDG